MIKYFTLAFLFTLHANSFAQDRPLVFATYTYSTNTRIQNLEPLAAWLEERTGADIKVVSYPTVKSLIRAIQHDSVDIAMMNTSGYLVLQKDRPGVAIPFLNLYMGNTAETNYGGCIIAARHAQVESIHEVNGKNLSMALVAPSSTSGNLVPRLLLNRVGIADAESAMKIYYAGTHKQVVQDVLAGKAELGGCGCAEVEEARKMNDFKEKAIVIADFNNIPLGPVIYRSGTDVQLISKFKNELVRIHQLSPVIFFKFCEGWTEFKQATRFKEVTDAEYDPFRKMFGNNQLLWTLIE